MADTLPPQIVIQTKSEERLYTFFPIVKTTLEFTLKSDHDNYICLTPSYSFNGPRYYEIIIGGWENTKSILRKDTEENYLDTNLGPILDIGKFNKFWIKIDKIERTIEVGKGEKDTYPFLKATDPDFVEMEYFGVSSKSNAAIEWFFDPDIVVKNMATKAPPLQIVLQNNSEERLYSFFPLVKTTLEFKIRCDHDSYICLTPSYSFNGPRYYEMIIGGWENSKSILRKDKEENYLDIYLGPILDTEKFNTFWIKLDNIKGTIEVGKGEKDTQPFLKATDPDFVEMEYFGVSSINRAAIEWLIDPDILVS